MFKSKKLIFHVMAVLFLLSFGSVKADFLRNKDGKSISTQTQPKEQIPAAGNKLLREYKTLFDLQENTVSNFQFFTTNYGILFFDVAHGVGGGYWPRGSQNQYIFAGGVWFGAQKTMPNHDSSNKFKMVSITYNPNSGKGWYVPGRINLGGPGATDTPDMDEVDNSDILTYRTYFSTNFLVSTGLPLNVDDRYNWPIWDASTIDEDTLQHKGYFGYYVPNTGLRNIETYKKGPAFISGEDIFATYKDTDLNYYEGGFARKVTGYPLRLQIEQMIYSWGFGDYKDFIFVKYDITNYSKDTLWECWLSPIMDVDIARAPATAFGAGNDLVRFYDKDTSLNLCAQWTKPDRFEGGNGFGYLGFDFLESPITCHDYERYICRYDTVWANPDTNTIIKKIDTILCSREYLTDSTSFLRKDKDYTDDDQGKVFKTHNQLGLKTFHNWNIEEDKNTDQDRYSFISGGVKDPYDPQAGDKRFMMSTGPFNIRPHDTIRTVVALIFASTSKGSEADGTDEDMAELVRRDEFAQKVYDNNFLAPRPPDQSILQWWKGSNNSITIHWDSTSEVSLDANERGMAFLGYKIYRARRTDLDTFNLSNIGGDANYPLGRGPLGWKLVAQYAMQSPFDKSTVLSGTNKSTANPYIDQIYIIGPNYNPDGSIDSSTIKIMRTGKGMQDKHYLVKSMRDINYTNGTMTKCLPLITNIDSSIVYAPWGKYWINKLKGDPAVYIDSVSNLYRYGKTPDGLRDTTYLGLTYTTWNAAYPKLFTDVLFGYIKLNPSLIKWNPLYYETKGVTRSGLLINNLHSNENFADGGIGPLKDTAQKNKVTGVWDTIKIRTSIDSIYYWNTITNSERTGFFNLEVGYKRTDVNQATSDRLFIEALEDSVYQYVNRGWAQLIFPHLSPDGKDTIFEQTSEVRQQVIVPYMKYLTGDRTFTDIGDINRNGFIDTDLNPDKTETIINNIPYFYKVLAYDEGDFNQPTPSKINVGQVGTTNLMETNASSAPIGDKSQIEIIHVDSSLVGGLYNFNFYSVDQERLQQKFAGHYLELSFEPYWANGTFLLEKADAGNVSFDQVGLYRTNAILRDTTTNDTLFNSVIEYEPQPCYYSIFGLFSEWSATYIGTKQPVIDTISGITSTFGDFFGTGVVTRTGRFTLGNFNQTNWCNTMLPNSPAYGTLGFSFDYTIRQFGGYFRGDPETLTGLYGTDVEARTPIKYCPAIYNRNARKIWQYIYTTQPVKVDYSTWQINEASYNNGPGEYLIKFIPGGVETVEMNYNVAGKYPDATWSTKKFIIPYLNVQVTNKTKLLRPSDNGDSVSVSYPSDVPFMELPIWQSKKVQTYDSITTNAIYYTTQIDSLYNIDQLLPSPMNRDRAADKIDNQFIGKFNLYSQAWVNYRRTGIALNVSKYYALVNKQPFSDFMRFSETKLVETYSGLTQGRYYLSGVSEDGKDTIDFENVFDISGILFVSDYLNSGSFTPSGKSLLGKIDSLTVNGSKVAYDVYHFKDFKAGDEFTVKTTGGALGLPMPGAKILAKVTASVPEDAHYTDGQLDEIQVVPNPYYISHMGVKSPYDSKLYFTKLPRTCTIQIYTVAGNLIRTINHDVTDVTPDKASIEVWDLLSKNGQRIQSQSLIAVITTPDGAKTVKNFSVVVGGFRLISE